MEIIIAIVGSLIALIVGLIAGNLISKKLLNAKAETAAQKADNMLEATKAQIETLKKEAELEAKQEKSKIREEVESEYKDRIAEVRVSENRITQREQSLDKRSDTLDQREDHIESLTIDLENREDKISRAEQEINSQLERVSGMTAEAAKQELLANIKDEVNADAANIIRDAEARTKAEADKKSREILSVAIQRLASEYTAELTVTTIPLPSDDVKGLIIGREGRNIRSFETITGTDLIIDDSPETITISSHDPVRREIGAATMSKLLADGRIQPARIEETYNKIKRETERRIQEAGENAAFETGIHDLNGEIVSTLGRLRYRTSYGQNVLQHSLEVAYLAGMMATELGLDPTDAKRAGLLHDLGKAIDHDIEGSHAIIGADLAHKLGEKDHIVHAIQAHHEEVEPESIIDILVQAADAISAARPGARRESLENYIKRLEQLENIANSHDGVERTYAIQAGREVRVMVKPDKVDEDAATVMAHDIATEIERDMQYPGQVKVVVIRETRAEGLAK